ncbi:MAG: thioredoxin fold domain-containing protein [Gammaproteobacteria bacterium]|nr:MAG: thioredoxin fold domain-containing protein [Gammaproteobacteria bacterium]
MRRYLFAIIFLSLAVVAPASGDSARMIAVEDLREEARLVRDDNLLLVIEFSSEYCGYCRQLEELFLLPMQRNAEYRKKVLIRYVSLDAYETLVDFDGRSMSTSEFASRYGVSLTPTLIFLNGDGVELSEKLVGIWSEDFYGGFIDDRIDEAREKLASATAGL